MAPPGYPEDVLGRMIAATNNSLRAVRHALRSEAAFRQEAVVFLVALPLGALIAPSIGWYAAMIASLLVLLAIEMLNTGIETLADRVSTDHDEKIALAKDCGSAAVMFGIALCGLVWLAAIAARLFG